MFRKFLFKVLVAIAVVILIAISAKIIIHKIYPLDHSDYIKKYSAQYGLDPYLVMAVIKTESNYETDAKSNKNAYGLMQITDETGEWIAEKMNIDKFDVNMLYDPETNIKMGCWYLYDLKKEFDNNSDVVLAAYNAGRGHVKSWLSNESYSDNGVDLKYIPFNETDKYVKKVNTNYRIYKYIYCNKLE